LIWAETVMCRDKSEPRADEVLAAADDLVDEFEAVDLINLADAVERASGGEPDAAAFQAVAAELRRRAAAGVRLWPSGWLC
jgi:hypothetical protein